MCGVDLHGMREQPDPERSFVRACARCSTMRELAEERSQRRAGIVGGWEVVEHMLARPSPVDPDATVFLDAWVADDAQGGRWFVYRSSGKGYCAAVAAGGQPLRWVRKIGHVKRTHWPDDAKAMAGCEALARSGEYALDRPTAADGQKEKKRCRST